MSPPGPTRILLAESNRSDAFAIEEMLTCDAQGQFGFSRTGSLRDALDRTAREHFDAVLLDPFLPDSRGLETIRRFANAFHLFRDAVLSARHPSPAVKPVATARQAPFASGSSREQRIARGGVELASFTGV
jgi:CheY-like chemotaxis protein